MKRPNIKNYRQAAEFLNLKTDRPYANNTRIVLDNKIITVTLHGNAIVRFFPDQAVEFDSCGWKTPTTKERINWFLPDGFMLYQKNHKWFIENREQGITWIFENGMSIHFDGIVSGARIKV